MPRVLIVAYHFPPLRGSSGIQRTLRFCQYLPQFGWEPLVLTVQSRAYESVSEDLVAVLPPELPVTRAFALDAARHLSVRGRYPRFVADPDRWVSWLPGGVLAGLSLIRQYRPQALFSTYPIATAHRIALALHRRSGLPWIADFRDPMAQDDYPDDAVIRRHLHALEAQVVRHAARVLFTSASAIDACRERYPDVPADRFLLLENGYDEEAFAGLFPRPGTRRQVLLHSGIVYPWERDPTAFMRALGMLKRAGSVTADMLEVRFRASANDGLLRNLAHEHGVDDLVTLAPALPYREALAEMLEVDALLLLQAANCNSQIPAKAYEYLRAGKPIACFTDPHGDTAQLLRRAGLAPLAPLDAPERIAQALPPFLAAVRASTAAVAEPRFVQDCSRLARTQVLGTLLHAVAQ